MEFISEVPQWLITTHRESGQVPIVHLVCSGSNLGKPLLTLTRPKTG